MSIFLLQPGLVVVSVTAAVVSVVIIFHYEVIHFLNLWCDNRQKKSGHMFRHRPTILVAMFVLLFAHVAEIWLFGTTFWLLLGPEGYGAISGYSSVSLGDCVYIFRCHLHDGGLGGPGRHR